MLVYDQSRSLSQPLSCFHRACGCAGDKGVARAALAQKQNKDWEASLPIDHTPAYISHYADEVPVFVIIVVVIFLLFSYNTNYLYPATFILYYSFL